MPTPEHPPEDGTAEREEAAAPRSQGGSESSKKKAESPQVRSAAVLTLYSPRDGDQLPTSFEVYVGCAPDVAVVTASSNTGAAPPAPAPSVGGCYTGQFTGATPGDSYTVTVSGTGASSVSASDLTILGPAPIGAVIAIDGVAPGGGGGAAAYKGSSSVTVTGTYQASVVNLEPRITVRLEDPPKALQQMGKAVLTPNGAAHVGTWKAEFAAVDKGPQGKGRHYSFVAVMCEMSSSDGKMHETAHTSKGHKVV